MTSADKLVFGGAAAFVLYQLLAKPAPTSDWMSLAGLGQPAANHNTTWQPNGANLFRGVATVSVPNVNRGPINPHTGLPASTENTYSTSWGDPMPDTTPMTAAQNAAQQQAENIASGAAAQVSAAHGNAQDAQGVQGYVQYLGPGKYRYSATPLPGFDPGIIPTYRIAPNDYVAPPSGGVSGFGDGW